MILMMVCHSLAFLPKKLIISSYNSYVNNGSDKSRKKLFNNPATTCVSISLKSTSSTPAFTFCFRAAMCA